MKVNYRLRSWHSNIIEDTDGRTLCTAASAKEAFLILDALRGKNLAVAGSLEEADLEMLVSLINEVGMYGEAAALRGRMPEL